MSDAITLIEFLKLGDTEAVPDVPLDAWPYHELELELRVHQVDGPGSHHVTVLLETAASLGSGGLDPWRTIGRFTPMKSAGVDRRAFRHLLRYVRWRALANVSNVSAVFSIVGMAR